MFSYKISSDYFNNPVFWPMPFITYIKLKIINIIQNVLIKILIYNLIDSMNEYSFTIDTGISVTKATSHISQTIKLQSLLVICCIGASC